MMSVLVKGDDVRSGTKTKASDGQLQYGPAQESLWVNETSDTLHIRQESKYNNIIYIKYFFVYLHFHKVEHIIREDYLVEAMEMLELYCDLLLARFGLIETQQ